MSAGGEAVAAAVGVLDGPGSGAARNGPPGRTQPPSDARGRDDEPRRRVELAGVVALALVLAAADERRRARLRPAAGSRARAPSRRARAPAAPPRARPTSPLTKKTASRGRAPPTAARRRWPRGTSFRPRTVIVRSPVAVDVGERAPLRLPGRVPRGRRRRAPSSCARARWPCSSLPRRGEEERLRLRGSRAGRPRPRRRPAGSSQVSSAWTISPGAGTSLDADELDPLDVSDDGDLHDLTSSARSTFHVIDGGRERSAVRGFYEEHRDEVLGLPAAAASGASVRRMRSRRRSCARCARIPGSSTGSTCGPGC